MRISEDLLKPISGPNPSGQNLRASAGGYIVYDAIKEARREDDEAPQGDWIHERKRADYPSVLRLCCDALAKQTKDLQLAVWATEASLKLEGLTGLQRGLHFLEGLVETFWDTLYPELEDGDAEARAVVLEWLGDKFSRQLWYLPLTHDGLNWLQYKESRAVGYESDAAGNDDKMRDRDCAIGESKITAEVFDTAVSKTPKAFYDELRDDADACLASLESLNQTCESRFGKDRPSFAPLREALEETRQCVSIFLLRKREEEPKASLEESQAAVVQADSPADDIQQEQPGAVPLSAPTRSVSKEPEDVFDAIERIVLAARYLRREQPTSTVPYLVLRALRWGELRASVGSLDLAQLEAPTTEVRKRLRGMFQNNEWEELLDAAETAMASSCGRGWLDLQRYAVKACDGLGDGYAPVSLAIISELKALLSDYAQLSQSALDDETPAANPETQAWLAELTASAPEPFDGSSLPMNNEREGGGQLYEQVVDAFQLAKNAASSGHLQDAIEILEREVAQERSGRGRFQRKMQLAQICMSADYNNVALPILNALAEEIDERNLEDWEDADLVIHALRLLYQCMDKLKGSAEQKEKIYARICRLGPARALELAK